MILSQWHNCFVYWIWYEKGCSSINVKVELFFIMQKNNLCPQMGGIRSVRECCGLRTGWPEGSSKMSPNVCKKVAQKVTVFYLNSNVFNVPPKETKHLGYSWKIICHQELLKIAQPGHTAVLVDHLIVLPDPFPVVLVGGRLVGGRLVGGRLVGGRLVGGLLSFWAERETQRPASTETFVARVWPGNVNKRHLSKVF